MNILESFLQRMPPYRSEPAPPPGKFAGYTDAAQRAYRYRQMDVVAHQEEAVQARGIWDDAPEGSIEGLLLRIQGLRDSPWRVASVHEALGTPAIWAAVSLIANTAGSLSMEAFRNGVKLGYDETPQLVKRPNPLTTQRAFTRDTAYFMATRGEGWWYKARRDGDGNVISLVVVPPWEIVLQPREEDRQRPRLYWNGKERPLDDFVQITLMPDDRTYALGLRGLGPLQACQAAISIAVESQEWAADFYAGGGGVPSLVIKSASELREDPVTGVHEADTLRAQWMSRPGNVPRIVDPGIESIDEFGVNTQAAQMLDARQHETGNAARMFKIPGSLLEYQQAGSSLTYQNLEGEFTKFVRTCLAPDYLEPMEQAMSDLLTRSTAARYSVGGFLRADVKTRYEVYQIGIDTGVLTPQLAQEYEGIVPGNVEYASVPPSPPQAIPGPIAVRTEIEPPQPLRCDGRRLLRGNFAKCGKLLSETGVFVGRCPRCGKDWPAAA